MKKNNSEMDYMIEYFPPTRTRLHTSFNIGETFPLDVFFTHMATAGDDLIEKNETIASLKLTYFAPP